MRRFLVLFGASLAAVGLAFGVSAFDASEVEAARYSQVVDNATKGRFHAPGWGTSSCSSTRYGANYRFADPNASAKPAWYKVRIPARGNYTVFARWPSNAGYNPRTRYGVRTSSGWKWRVVNQRNNGGRWVRLGVYNMTPGDNFSIQVSRRSPSSGYIMADAIRVARGNVAAPAPSSGQASPGGGDSGGQVDGTRVLREARSWLGVPYRYGGTTRQGVDCSGFTLAVYRSLGINLPRVASDQYNSGPGAKVARTSRQRGFLIFGNTGNQRGIQHVGILVGNGDMIHAPYPGTVVRQEAVGSWYNAIGVKRIVPA
ncbi:MAG: C40 family peptidase [Rubrobacter sp.]|nr:C40 family peptidase [Rubrobacter sp.]